VQLHLAGTLLVYALLAAACTTLLVRLARRPPEATPAAVPFPPGR